MRTRALLSFIVVMSLTGLSAPAMAAGAAQETPGAPVGRVGDVRAAKPDQVDVGQVVPELPLTTAKPPSVVERDRTADALLVRPSPTPAVKQPTQSAQRSATTATLDVSLDRDVLPEGGIVVVSASVVGDPQVWRPILRFEVADDPGSATFCSVNVLTCEVEARIWQSSDVIVSLFSYSGSAPPYYDPADPVLQESVSVATGPTTWEVGPLEASADVVDAGDSVTLTITANQALDRNGGDVTFYSVPQGDTSGLDPACQMNCVPPLDAVGYCSSDTASCSVEYDPPTIGEHFIAATVSNSGTNVVVSNVLSVTLNAITVSISADADELHAGDSAQIVAEASHNVGSTAYFLQIQRVEDGRVVASCSFGTRCVLAATPNFGMPSQSFIGRLHTGAGGGGPIASRSSTTTVATPSLVTEPVTVWLVPWAIAITSNGIGQIMAATNHDVGMTPWSLQVVDLTDGTLVAECYEGTTCTADVEPSATYAAYVADWWADIAPPTDIQAEARTNWIDSDPAASITFEEAAAMFAVADQAFESREPITKDRYRTALVFEMLNVFNEAHATAVGLRAEQLLIQNPTATVRIDMGPFAMPLGASPTYSITGGGPKGGNGRADLVLEKATDPTSTLPPVRLLWEVKHDSIWGPAAANRQLKRYTGKDSTLVLGPAILPSPANGVSPITHLEVTVYNGASDGVQLYSVEGGIRHVYEVAVERLEAKNITEESIALGAVTVTDDDVETLPDGREVHTRVYTIPALEIAWVIEVTYTRVVVIIPIP